MPTLPQYLRHAKLYGCDSIHPTAIEEADLSAREVLDLKLGLAKIATENRKAKRPACWSDDVPKVDESDVLALDREGFTTSEIVTLTGLSLRRVEAALVESGQVSDVPEEARNHAGSTREFSQESPGTSSRSDSAVSAMHSPLAKAKAAETRARRQAQKDADVVKLRRERGMVPGGIAKVLGIGEPRVRKILRAEGLL